MADFITVHLKASREVIDSLINKTPGHNHEGQVDFNCVLPTPSNIYQGNLSEDAVKIHGDNTWYTWNSRNWGVKWNAFDTLKKSAKSVYFCTAWTRPTALLLALSRKFPNDEIRIRVAGETNSYFAGEFSYLNGVETLVFYPDPCSQQQARFARKVRNRQFA